MTNIIKIIVLLSVIFSITNYVPVSVAVILLLPLALITLFYKSNYPQISKIELYLILLFVYVLLSTALYDPTSFTDFDFYRRDGNFIISYLVLFVFIFMPMNINFDLSKIKRLIFPFFTLISAIAYVIMPTEIGGVHHLLFISHNAAGGFYSVVGGLAVGFFLTERKWPYAFYTLVFLFLLNATDSRGSILALICAVGYYFIKFKRPAVVFIAFLFVQIAIVMYTYDSWLYTGQVYASDQVPVQGLMIDFQRANTFITRIFYLWPRAWDNFLHSPIVGTGFGSYDDRYYQYVTVIPHFLSIKEGQVIAHSDAHAHNSLFNILGELGIVGLGLFILLFNEIRKKIVEITIADNKLGNALAIAFWTCIFSSATEHRITTPSQMLPFFLFFGMAYVKYCKEKSIN
ncbi:O-antigen ligase family protein [Sodalis sp. RH20]|uniref:O-antigen ligase family protein n=1 Tax=unclassified Sodalis (in: enterobacteria) TaxID=2636512 RepID=UPI0039B46EEF